MSIGITHDGGSDWGSMKEREPSIKSPASPQISRHAIMTHRKKSHKNKNL